MVRTKTNTQNNTKTHRTPRRNKNLEQNPYFCIFLDNSFLNFAISTEGMKMIHIPQSIILYAVKHKTCF